MKLYEEIAMTTTAAFPELSDAGFNIQPSPENQPGDFGFACFQFAKILGLAPQVIARKIAGLEFPSAITEVTSTGEYVNFTIDRDIFATELIGEILDKKETFGSSGKDIGKKVILEHTSINPNASPHIGRARNGLIGDTLARLFRFEGYDVNVHYYINDMGKQIGLLVLQTRGMEELEFDDILELYVEANKRAKENTEFEARGLEMIARMENGDPEVVATFQGIVDICLRGQLSIFERLGISYDTFDRESSFLRISNMSEIMEVLERRGALFTDDQCRKVLDLKPLGYPDEEGRYVVLMRANGSSMYMYRDIAYTLEKSARGSDMNLIVLGEDHKMYFKQMEVVIRALGKKPPEAVHYSYIILKDGKMSTRQGTVILLEEFLDEAIRRARERVEEQCMDMSEEERAEIARKIGIGAVRFAILSVRPNRNVVFDWETALSFTGDSGPYIQYSCTRISSILRKYGQATRERECNKGRKILLTHDAEWNLIFRLAAVNRDISMALSSRNPGLIAMTALDIARKFSVFYNECPVLNAPDEQVRRSRRAICIATRRVLMNLLYLLGIEVPERM